MKGETYELYLWAPEIREPVIALLRPRRRGKRIGRFQRYKDLVAEAQRRAVAAGYPKSRWSDLFDWATA